MNASERRIADLRDSLFETYIHPLDLAVRDCESPIEQMMFWALLSEISFKSPMLSLPTADYLPLNLCCISYGPPNAGAWVISFPSGNDAHEIEIYVQPEISTEGQLFRLDFLIRMWANHAGNRFAETFVAVECDGHDFHEKTKEQAQRDKARDRALQGIGFLVARFTGAEIFASPEKAAEEAWRLASTSHQQRVDAELSLTKSQTASP